MSTYKVAKTKEYCNTTSGLISGDGVNTSMVGSAANDGSEGSQGGTWTPVRSETSHLGHSTKSVSRGPDINEPGNARSDDLGVSGNVRTSAPMPAAVKVRTSPKIPTTRKTPGPGAEPRLCSTVTIPPIMHDGNSNPWDNPSSIATRANVIVGFDKLRQLLTPKHSYFSDKQAAIDGFAKYKHSVDDEYGLLFARVKGRNPYATKNNPYRKYQLSRAHSGRTISQVAGVVEANELDDLRIACLSWTIPEDMSKSLAALKGKGREFLWNCFKRLANNDMPSILGVPGEFGSVNNLHVWSTKEPLKPHYHIHQILFNYVLVGNSFEKWFGEGISKKYVGSDDKVKYGPVAFASEDLVKLKIAWIMRLKACCKRNKIKSQYLDNLDMNLMTGSELASKIDVHVSYVSWNGGENRPRFINKFNYQKRHWIEDYVKFSNHNLDCAVPPEWLEKYENRTRPLGWWCGCKAFGGIPEKNGEKISPFTAEKMVKDFDTSVYGVLSKNNGILGGMVIVRGSPVIWQLCQDEVSWLAKSSLDEFSWPVQSLIAQ